MEPSVIQCVPIASCLGIGHHWKEPGFVIFAPSLTSGIYGWSPLPKPPLLKAQWFQLSQSFPKEEILPSLHRLHGSILDCLHYADVSLVQEGHRCGLTSAKQKGTIPSLDMLATLLQDSLLCGKGTLVAHVQLGVHQDPQVLFAVVLSNSLVSNIFLFMGLFLHRCRALQFPLLQYMWFLSAYFSRQLRSL